MIGETDKRPIHVKLMPSDEGMARLAALTLLSLIPIAVAILMQNPGLRQAISMRVWHSGEITAKRFARSFEVVAHRCHDMYEIARL